MQTKRRGACLPVLPFPRGLDVAPYSTSSAHLELSLEEYLTAWVGVSARAFLAELRWLSGLNGPLADWQQAGHAGNQRPTNQERRRLMYG